MKKLALALVCLVSVAFFASCTPKGQPTISVLAENGCVTDGDTVTLNTNFPFGFVLASSTETNSKLAKLVVTVDTAKWAEIDLSGTSYTYRDTIRFTLDREIIGTSVIKATVIDAKGETASTSITLNIKKALEPVLVVKDFTWVKLGGNVTGNLAEYGLEWTGNGKEIFATIAPIDNATLYQFDLNTEGFNGVTTESAKAALFEGISPIANYRGVSAWASHDYEDVLGTIYKGKHHLLIVKHGEVKTVSSQGTQVTITGQSK